MGYRLLALDLDGTLLRRDQSVDPRDTAAIGELQRAGVTVTIVTGRLQSGAAGAARACAIEGAIGCCEGSHLVEMASGTTLAHHHLDDEAIALLRATIRTHQLAGFVFAADGIHHDHAGAPYASYVRTWSPNLRLVEEELAWQTMPLATIAVGEPDAIASAHAALSAHADRVFTVSFPVYDLPDRHAILVRATGPTKGTALAELCRVAGCDLSEAVSIGDWLNDIPMFEVAGRSFAMGSSPEAVCATATDVLATTAGAGGGIAEAIRLAWG